MLLTDYMRDSCKVDLLGVHCIPQEMSDFVHSDIHQTSATSVVFVILKIFNVDRTYRSG